MLGGMLAGTVCRSRVLGSLSGRLNGECLGRLATLRYSAVIPLWGSFWSPRIRIVRMTIPCVISTKPSMQWVKTHGYLVWRSGFRDMECNIQCWTITFVQKMDASLASRASLVKLLFFRLPETHGDNRKVPISTRSLF